jgi:hypothetical protein
MNRAQQAKYAEDGKFANFDNLGLGIKTQTTNYTYAVSPATPAPTDTFVGNIGTPLSKSLKGYTGTVALGTNSATSETTTVAILCETKTAEGNSAAIATGNPPVCGANDTEVSK